MSDQSADNDAACSDWPGACQHTPAHDNGKWAPEPASADYDAPEKSLGGDVTDVLITDYPHTPPVARPCGRDDCREGHAYVLDGDWYRCVIPPASTIKESK